MDSIPPVLRMQCLKFGAVAPWRRWLLLFNGDIPLVDHGRKALDVEAGQQITICAAGPNVL